MEVHEIDFYTGFEGESELIFIQKVDGHQSKLILWEGYFDRMMENIYFSSTDGWIGIAYYYHLGLGCWEDEEDWEIPNLKEVVSQLEEIKMSDEDGQTYAALKALVQFLKRAVEEKRHVSITRY